ncbi:Pentatricopeptide repeat-containing protein [Zostera marina]|uniref:Pentatricopeptide repeat-containing protein n=1 Tax=Zostera marina TaxID=29655 RepID=A0A0K9PUN2_ZOSMR|nr:Pentatricopeptide repeat-containing protein [Zostera marina]
MIRINLLSLPKKRIQINTSIAGRRHFSKSQPPPIRISPARLRKLIATHPDPLVAKEILSLAASLDPTFLTSPTSYPPIHTLILRLARARHFSLADNLLRRLCTPSPGLYSSLLRIYSESSPSPDLVLTTFRNLTIRCPEICRPRHLNRTLAALLPHSNYLSKAVSLFNSALQGSLCDGVVSPNAQSLNIVMTQACRMNKLSVAYSLFNRMSEKGIRPNVESYRILMQGLCRKNQVNSAVDLLDEMLNRGYVPDALSYTTLLNSLCRKKKLREAYKMLCRMKVKGCNPDIVHFNTTITGFCREGRAQDACKIIDEMADNGCMPNLASYTLIANGLCAQGLLEEAQGYVKQMVKNGFVPHFSVFHGLINGFCSVGKDEDACEVLEQMMLNHHHHHQQQQSVIPHRETWELIVPRICGEDGENKLADAVDKVLMTEDELRRNTKIVDVGFDVEDYMLRRKKW